MFKRYLLHPAFFFACTSIIFLWPLSMLLFSLKNDALTYYYPVRTLIADALRNSELPLWTPFINMGYPLHADMQSSAWNPITWLIGLATNYGLAAFHYEALFYFSIAGIGFYYLCRDIRCNKLTALTTGVAYQFSGFMVDSPQFFNCLPSAALLPFIILFTRRLVQHKKNLDAVALGVMFYLLFTGGYPSLFIISCYIVLAWLLFAFFSSDKKTVFLRQLLLPLGASALCFTLLSAPAILSYLQHLPLISRGKSQTLSFVQENSMNPAAMLSMLAPFATTAKENWLQSDVIMRNIYIGIIPLIFAVLAIFNKNCLKNREFRFFLFMFLLTLGLAFGKYFLLRAAAYQFLPLMDSFRHPALFRLFSIFFLLLMAAMGMKEFNRERFRRFAWRKFIPGFALVVLGGLLSVCILTFNNNARHTAWKGITDFFSNYSFLQGFVLQAPIIIFVLSVSYYAFIRNSSKLLLFITVADLFVATQLNLPVTVIGAKNFHEVEHFVNRNATAFPLPGKASIAENSINSTGPAVITGSTLPFTKKIGRNDYYISPGNLLLQDSFYESSLKDVAFSLPPAAIINNPPGSVVSAAVAETSNLDSFKLAPVNFIDLSANTASMEFTATKPATLLYMQNYYPGWEAYEDGRKLKISPAFLTFMSVPVSPGKHKIEFHYLPRSIHYAFAVSVLSLISVVLFFVLHLLKKRSKRYAA